MATRRVLMLFFRCKEFWIFWGLKINFSWCLYFRWFTLVFFGDRQISSLWKMLKSLITPYYERVDVFWLDFRTLRFFHIFDPKIAFFDKKLSYMYGSFRDRNLFFHDVDIFVGLHSWFWKSSISSLWKILKSIITSY